jgi:ABC-type amino acid transport substrate-binding protein
VAAFSRPVFPTQVWVVARADSSVRPIVPAGEVGKDIAAVRAALAGRRLLGVRSTCLDPALYQLEQTRARLVLEPLRLDEVAPALIRGDAELALLDVADAMIALAKWPGALKVVGPVSAEQEMAAAFRRDAPRLREAFDAFLVELERDGTYAALVQAYFPGAPLHFRAFFEARRGEAGPRTPAGGAGGDARERADGAR